MKIRRPGLLPLLLLLSFCAAFFGHTESYAQKSFGFPEAASVSAGASKIAAGSELLETPATTLTTPPATTPATILADNPVDNAAETRVWILHTNDHHGALESTNNHGALPQLATKIREIRLQAKEVNAATLLLDAGDINSGSLMSDAFQALPDILAYNQIGYDAMAIGNHEFDNGLACLEKQMKQAQFAFLSANIRHQDGRYWGVPYLVKSCGAVRVGVFGLTVSNKTILAVSDPDLVIEGEIETARRMIRLLREEEKADLVIALTHLGILEEAPGEVTSIQLAQETSGIDLIVDGHSHTAMERPLIVAGVPIVSAHCRSDRLGLARFTRSRLQKSAPKSEQTSVSPFEVETGTAAGQATGLEVRSSNSFDFQWECWTITDDTPPDPDIQKILAPFVECVQVSRTLIVGQNARELPFGDNLPRRGETAVGNLLCDATMWLGESRGEKLDFVIHNGGGIRTGLPIGPISEEVVADCLPFQNTIVFLTLTGDQVLELFRHVERQLPGTGAFPQVSRSVRYTIVFDENKTGALSGLTIDGAPVDPKQLYRVGTNSYMTGGGNGYETLKRGTNQKDTALSCKNMTIQYIKSLPQPFEVKTDGHVQVHVLRPDAESP